ncbi:MAG: endonuclease III, partial [Clostridia bacterium]
EELLSLPGVGRKTANLILGDVFGKPAIVCDTHCIRLSNRLGLVSVKDPTRVERELVKIVPACDGAMMCHRFVLHGRAVCTARSPKCSECTLSGICNAVERGV